jgi:hypothetical protein
LSGLHLHPVLNKPFVTAMVIPTGVGASVGGFAGDATPYLNLLASVSDVLITHPNVANAAIFQKLPENALYVEGYGLDQFFRGLWGLTPVRTNRIGVLLDSGIPPDMLTLHLNTMNAVHSVYGINIVGYALTEAPVDSWCEQTASGCSSGGVNNPQVILNGVGKLLNQGAEAIALCTMMPEVAEQHDVLESAYRSGEGVDIIGGIEGILSHLVTAHFKIPCAHAPVFCWETAAPVLDKLLDPRVAAEFIAPTFFPCVLTGLSRSPQYSLCPPFNQGKDLAIQDCSALVIPESTLGGIPVLSALEHHIPVLAVKGNTTVLSVKPDCWSELTGSHTILSVNTYEEAAGVLQMQRLGLSRKLGGLPERRPCIH